MTTKDADEICRQLEAICQRAKRLVRSSVRAETTTCSPQYFEPCPYCGGPAASYQDGVVDVLHGDDCPQGDCEPFRMSLVADVQKWNNWAKQVKASRPA